MTAPVVHFITRKPLVNNARVFKQAATLRAAGYEVVLVGVRRGPLPGREERDGIAISRLAHDPLPERLSLWLRRGGLSPATVRESTTGLERRGQLARRRLLLAARAGGALPWIVQSAAFYVRAYRLLTRAAPAPAVVHASDLRTLPVAALVAGRYRVPLVYDVPELFSGMHALPRSYRALLQVQERLLVPRADRIIAVNPAIARILEHRHRRRVDAVILNCPPYEAASPTRDGWGLRAALGVPAPTPILLYSGGLLPYRGTEQTVLALHGLPGVVLAILGEGELKPQLQALAAREGLLDRVRFCDFVPWDQVAAFIRSADVGIVPYLNAGTNHYLSSPGKLFEYLMAELPVASSDFPYLRELVAGEGVGTLFDPADPSSIATAVAAILEDPGRYRERIAEVRRRYSWEEEGRRFLEVYDSLGLAAAGVTPPPPTAAGARPGSAPPRSRPR